MPPTTSRGLAAARPSPATSPPADIVALNVLTSVVPNTFDTAPDAKPGAIPGVRPLVEERAKRAGRGKKTRRGFYQRVAKDGEAHILSLDWQKMDYRPQQKARFASIEAGKTIEDTRARLRTLLAPIFSGQGGDKGAKFLWGALSEMCLYAARRVPEIADAVVDVDRAMRWGFAWELGPFEIWDAVGVEVMAKQIEHAGKPLPPLVTRLLSSGQKSFYQSAQGRVSQFDLASAAYKPVVESEGVIILKSLKERSKEIENNPGASLIDLGDGVVCCEFHGKMNAIGADLVAMLHKGLKRLDTDFDAMVIANQATNFSVGANLMLVLVAAQEQEWDELHLAVRQFQNVNLAMKYAPKPVVASPQGMALGGGCELSLHAPRMHAAAEAYIGLVETGVGLIPGGGGTKEMLIRANERAGIAPGGVYPGAAGRPASSSAESDLDLFHALKPIFETVAMAKVCTSAEECREYGFLRREDGVSMNRDRLVSDAN